MATLYNLEPQPTAKVILQTTAGDIVLEIWTKQTPLASRNFLQHCLDGYYSQTIFHRLVPGFIIQGGDPTGTGAGGDAASNNGLPFEDEFHSRLKYNRRGLLGMANDGPNTNGSQFFLTLGATPELQGKNTMFGRVEGETIYNLVKMAEAELEEGEGSERPMYPTRITGTEVVVNPFVDMLARVKEAPRTRDDVEKAAKKRKKPAGKQVLSFADGDEEEPVAPVVKKSKANPKLVSAGMEALEKLNNATMPEAPLPTKSAKARKQKPSSNSSSPVRSNPTRTKAETVDMDDDEKAETEPVVTTSSALDLMNAEIAAVKASMKRTGGMAAEAKSKPKKALEAMIPTTSTRGRKRGKIMDEKGALDIFNAFKQRLEVLQKEHPKMNGNAGHTEDTALTDAPTITADAEEDEEVALCDLHFIVNCQSCKSWDEEKPYLHAEQDGDDDPGWMAHSLSFAKDTLGKDLEWKRRMEEIEVIDPREKARSIKEEQRKGKEKVK